MKITITFDIDAEEREAIEAQSSDTGKKAGYESCKTWLKAQAEGALEEISFNYWQYREID